MGLRSVLVNGTTYRVSFPFELLGQLRNVSNYHKVKQVFILVARCGGGACAN